MRSVRDSQGLGGRFETQTTALTCNRPKEDGGRTRGKRKTRGETMGNGMESTEKTWATILGSIMSESVAREGGKVNLEIPGAETV